MKKRILLIAVLILFNRIPVRSQDSLAIYSKQIISLYKSKEIEQSNTIFQKKISLLQKTDNLEEELYAYWDYFMLKPIEERLELIQNIDKIIKRKPKTQNEHLARLHLWVNQGYHLKTYGAIFKSILAYENAWNYYKKNSITSYNIIDYCLKPLANNCTRIGDYTRSEEILKRTLQLAIKEENTVQISTTLTNLATTYHSQGKNKQAIDILQQALQIQTNSHFQQARIYSEIAQNQYSLGNYKKALQSVVVSNKKLSKSQNNNLGITIKNLTTKSICYFYLKQNKLALNSIKKAISISKNYDKSIARETAKLYVLKAKIFEKRANYQKAFESYQMGLQAVFPTFRPKNASENPNLNLLYPENTLKEIFDAKAQLFTLKNEFEKAITNYNLSFKVEDLLRATYSSQTSKIIQQTENKNRSDKVLDLYYQLYTKQKNNKWIENAFQYAEKSKSLVLLDELKNKKIKNRYQNDSLIIKEQVLTKKKARINFEIKSIKLATHFDKKKLEKLVIERDHISNDLQIIKDLINKKYAFVNTDKTSELQIIRNNIDLEKQAIIEFFVGKQKTYIFLISKNQPIDWRVISNQSYQDSLQNLLSFYADNNGVNIANNLQEFKDISLEIYKVLLQPEIEKIKSKYILIIPDALLAFIPFDALLTNKTEGLQFGKFPFLINDFTISYAYSTQILLQDSAKNEIENEFVGFFPVFQNQARSLNPLPYTLVEAKLIKDIFSKQFFLEENATKNQFDKIKKNSRIIHLSTHANMNTAEKLTAVEFFDDALHLEELYAHRILADLLVLSACETGIGQVHKGEGAMSLARGFSYAGVKNLLVSLWQVNDKATSLLMGDFYKNLAKGTSFEKALHSSKTNYLNDEKISNSKKSPYYWAGFVPIKNTKETFSIEKNHSPLWFIYLFLTLVILLVIFLVVYKNSFKPKFL